MTLWRWQQPGSGTPETNHLPDNTYMIPPARLIGRDGELKQPFWVKEDVLRFKAEIGRQRRPAGEAGNSSAVA